MEIHVNKSNDVSSVWLNEDFDRTKTFCTLHKFQENPPNTIVLQSPPKLIILHVSILYNYTQYILHLCTCATDLEKNTTNKYNHYITIKNPFI